MYYPIRKLERWPCLHETRCLVGCTVFPVTVPPPFPQPVLPGQGRERGDPDGPQSFPESFQLPDLVSLFFEETGMASVLDFLVVSEPQISTPT